ncbi:MAG: CRISPR-associated helicase Cas3' [Deltaproteobacteria bacterium]|nr:CRISPR-associated helicase Cas3' [Deltaproteobacteria bacterium]
MYQALWAKYRTGERNFHPLLFHLMDVAAVTECLWQSVLERQFRKEVSARLGLTTEQAGKWLAFWAGLHDLGKASPAFQGKWKAAWDHLDPELRKRKLPNDPLPHGILTAAFVPELLTERFPGFPRTLADGLGRALGGHHGNFPRSGDLRDINKDQRGGGKWKEVRRELFRQFAGQFRLDEAGVLEDDPEHSFFLLLAGLVSVADWIGSNQNFFQFADADLDPKKYAVQARDNALNALKTLGWLGWRPLTDFPKMGDLFPAIKKYGLRPLQETTVHLAKKLTEPGLVIIEAPMGEGKTEAAMYLADRWSVALGQRGCYFALPTMATSNQMFSRVKEFLQDRYPDELVNFQLLHGHAALSAEFQLLREKGARLFAPTEIDAEEKLVPGRPVPEVMAAEWFTYRKRGLLAPFGVGTVDQALLAVLKTKHYFVRLFGLAGKTVIVDEVHAYDAYMMKLLERLLEWLAACGCSVVLLSATLPGARRLALVKSFIRGLGRDDTTLNLPDRPYPRLTWMSRTSWDVEVECFEASTQFSRTIRYEWVNGAIPPETGQVFALGASLQEALAGGGCAAVICNTVGRAQELYRALKPFFPGDDAGDGQPELSLFHARNLYKDREKREGQALRRFSKPSEPKVQRPHRAVLVATQVIEQSLDLDFDLMVTEMAPVDLLLQRSGRLHRHERTRPPGLERPQLWIISPDLVDEAPNFGKGTEWVYDRHILLSSWLILKDRSAVAIPADVEDLIEAVYGEGDPPENLSLLLVQAWKESLKDLRDDLERDAVEARFRYILPPYYGDDILEDHNPELEEDAPEVHQSLQAATRLGDPSISLICLYGDEGKVTLEIDGHNLVNLEEKPSNEAVLALMRRSVSLSHRGLVPWLIRNAERPPGWEKHPLLCRCRLLRLDKNHSWRGDGYELRVDPEEGVIITKPGKEVV